MERGHKGPRDYAWRATTSYPSVNAHIKDLWRNQGRTLTRNAIHPQSRRNSDLFSGVLYDFVGFFLCTDSGSVIFSGEDNVKNAML